MKGGKRSSWVGQSAVLLELKETNISFTTTLLRYSLLVLTIDGKQGYPVE